jgi:1-acyl-sn-glycerol-3-phosphate acyltransferase
MSYTPFSQRSQKGAAAASSSPSGKPLVVILAEAKKQGRPVIVFVEGVRTNGAGVLEFKSQVCYRHTYILTV